MANASAAGPSRTGAARTQVEPAHEVRHRTRLQGDRRGADHARPYPRRLAARATRRDRALAAALAALAFVLALLQRPGQASSDTKIDLHVDPAGFLGDVASAWSSTGDLGHVQGGQYGGYLFPMGPFFALAHALGVGAVARRSGCGSG